MVVGRQLEVARDFVVSHCVGSSIGSPYLGGPYFSCATLALLLAIVSVALLGALGCLCCRARVRVVRTGDTVSESYVVLPSGATIIVR